MTDSTAHAVAETAARHVGGRKWFALTVLALPALLASLELTITNLALPSIARDLPATSGQLLWTVDIYAFVLAGCLILMGAWGDRVGPRRVLLVGAAGYGCASLLAAYAGSIEVLIAARALMGVAGATLMPSILSLIAGLFVDPKQRATAIAAIVATISGGTALGPLVGGWLLDHFRWGSVFLLAVPVIVVTLVAVPLVVPGRSGARGGRLDVPSALLSIAAILAVVQGIKQMLTLGWSWWAAVAVLAGVLLAGAFVARQRRLAAPLVDLSLFGNRTFALAGASLGLGIFVLWGSNYAIAQYLQLVLGLSPLTAGLWTAPSALGVILGSSVAPHLARHVRPMLIIAIGLLVTGAGYLILTRVGGTGSLPILIGGALIVSAGLGPLMALSNDLMIGAAPPHRSGRAAAVASTISQLGGALGIALLGGVITATYRFRVAGTVPGDTSPAVVALFEENLSAAGRAAAPVPAPLADDLLGRAREAFTDGFQVAAGLSALLVIAAASLLLLFGRPRPQRGAT
ncbi:MFS transporter [Granulicoccus phenolivorans]|uniref:MFS transporter n=1 Tax=Granulicoccus phenolivorans TaxID=266854 RepID=UPI0003FBA5DF|nr:MFS transporter [Granulicoccus phenolivorans]